MATANNYSLVSTGTQISYKNSIILSRAISIPHFICIGLELCYKYFMPSFIIDKHNKVEVVVPSPANKLELPDDFLSNEIMSSWS